MGKSETVYKQIEKEKRERERERESERERERERVKNIERKRDISLVYVNVTHSSPLVSC
jgi:hypothetical protein